MFCPVCGAAELVHGVHAIAYTYKGRTTSFQLESDKCPACGETVLAKPECDRLDALMEAFERSVNTEPLPIGIGEGWLKEDVVYLLPSRQKENVFGS